MVIYNKKILLERRYDKPLSIYSGFDGWPFSEIFPTNVSLWNQYKYISFNIFSCRILTISYKKLIIKKNKWINHIWSIWPNCRKFLRARTTFLFHVLGKLKAWRSSKLNFSSNCFIADDSHVKVVWLHVVIYSEQSILHF